MRRLLTIKKVGLIMKSFFPNKLSVATLIAALAVSGIALGQGADDADTADLEEENIDAMLEDDSYASDGMVEEVIVTGSRLRRDTFSSVSPLQVINAEIQKEAGMIDAADILQSSTVSAGQQVDLTFQGFVLTNGPGASTVDLRGLGASRNLVLINGRRISPSGVAQTPLPELSTRYFGRILTVSSSKFSQIIQSSPVARIPQ
jgi:iron complex outermembrane receptor protein